MTTNLTGAFYNRTGSLKLAYIYKNILALIVKCPKESKYRKNVEEIISHRLCIVKAAEYDREEIEEKIRCGSLEELICQANAEYMLLQKMILWKPWEDLTEQAPPGQWKWPPY